MIVFYQIADTPWRQVLTSIPFWTCIVTQAMKLSVMYTILNELPKYLQGLYGYEDGLLIFLMLYNYSKI